MGTQQTHPIIAQAIKHFGSQDRMAKAVGSSQSAISRMLLGEMPVPAQIAVALDRASAGRFPRWATRPDLWDAPAIKAAERGPVEARL